MIVTEKIDGTSGSIYIGEDGEFLVGSRNRWITPGKATDNYGFAAWCYERKDALVEALGPGHHFGEWYGQGIARNYGLKEKRFALFNVKRWKKFNLTVDDDVYGLIGFFAGETDKRTMLPDFLDLVPVLYRGEFDSHTVNAALSELGKRGSHIAPGFMNPEGVVVYHVASKQLFKKTLGNDGHKGGS